MDQQARLYVSVYAVRTVLYVASRYGCSLPVYVCLCVSAVLRCMSVSSICVATDLMAVPVDRGPVVGSLGVLVGDPEVAGLEEVDERAEQHLITGSDEQAGRVVREGGECKEDRQAGWLREDGGDKEWVREPNRTCSQA